MHNNHRNVTSTYLLGGLETETDAVVQTQTLLLVDLFTVQVDTVLLLERTLVLLQPMKLEIHPTEDREESLVRTTFDS